MSTSKPLPAIDHMSAPFWEGCRAHEIRMQCCVECGKIRFPAGPACTQCGSVRSEWTKSAGRGRVYSWIVVRHPIPASIYASQVPYVVALVEMEGGSRMPANIVGCKPEDITGGMELQVSFADVNEKVSLPQFSPVQAAVTEKCPFSGRAVQ